jgi:hypothetical protein
MFRDRSDDDAAITVSYENHGPAHRINGAARCGNVILEGRLWWLSNTHLESVLHPASDCLARPEITGSIRGSRAESR